MKSWFYAVLDNMSTGDTFSYSVHLRYRMRILLVMFCCITPQHDVNVMLLIHVSMYKFIHAGFKNMYLCILNCIYGAHAPKDGEYTYFSIFVVVMHHWSMIFVISLSVATQAHC